jgi:hypothetical protein
MALLPTCDPPSCSDAEALAQASKACASAKASATPTRRGTADNKKNSSIDMEEFL